MKYDLYLLELEGQMLKASVFHRMRKSQESQSSSIHHDPTLVHGSVQFETTSFYPSPVGEPQNGQEGETKPTQVNHLLQLSETLKAMRKQQF